MLERIARSLPRVLVCLALLPGPSCTVLPRPGYEPAEEFEVQVLYRFTDSKPQHRVRVPMTAGEVTVLHLHAEPAPLRETFSGAKRWLHTDAQNLLLRCRYRVRQGMATPPPANFFPGASQIRLLEREVSATSVER